MSAGTLVTAAKGENGRILLRALSLLILVVIWQLAATVIDDAGILPGPLATASVAWEQIRTGEMPFHIGITLLRVAAAFVSAMIIGTAIGITIGRVRVLDDMFDGWLVVAINIPALVTIVLCYVWFGLTEVAAILAVALNKAPTVVAITREGARSLDRSLLEMAQIFNVPRLRVLLRIVLPQLAPSIMGAARAGLALTWKIVLVVELLGRPDGVGFQIRRFFNFFDITGIFAYTLVFIAVMLAIEGMILKPIDRRLNRWRKV